MRCGNEAAAENGPADAGSRTYRSTSCAPSALPNVDERSRVRTRNTTKYLTRMGWDVTVVTPDPSVWRRVERAEQVAAELEQEGTRRILTGHRWRALHADELLLVGLGHSHGLPECSTGDAPAK